MQKKLVVFDCEGVLTEEKSSWGLLHKYFGSYDNTYFASLYARGLISYLDWMKIDIALMIHSHGRPITRKDVERALEQVKTRSTARDVVNEIKRRGHIVAVVSSGVDLVVKRICRELGIEICLSNELIFVNDELIPGGIEHVPLKDKKSVIARLASDLGVDLRDVIYIGDSEWDINVFRYVPISIAVEPCGSACSHATYTVKELHEILRLGIL